MSSSRTACDGCSGMWRCAPSAPRRGGLAEDLESGEESGVDVRRPPGVTWRKAAGVLAAAAVFVVVGLVMRQESTAPDPVTRAAGVATLALEIAADPLPRGQCLLRWTAFEGARYDVVVTTENLDAVAKAVGLDRAEYLVPEENLSSSRTGEPLLVYIEVHRPGEGTIASGTFPFRVR